MRGSRPFWPRILVLDDLEAPLLQIDEDLVRKGLSAAEKAALIAERRDIYNKTHNDRARAAHSTNKRLGRLNASDTLSSAFTEILAASTEVGRKTIDLLPKSLKGVRHYPALPYPIMCEFIAKLARQNGIAARRIEFIF